MRVRLLLPWTFRGFRFDEGDVLGLTPFRASLLLQGGIAYEVTPEDHGETEVMFCPEFLSPPITM
jgi:hypothetical protein